MAIPPLPASRRVNACERVYARIRQMHNSASDYRVRGPVLDAYVHVASLDVGRSNRLARFGANTAPGRYGSGVRFDASIVRIMTPRPRRLGLVPLRPVPGGRLARDDGPRKHVERLHTARSRTRVDRSRHDSHRDRRRTSRSNQRAVHPGADPVIPESTGALPNATSGARPEHARTVEPVDRMPGLERP